MTKTQLYKEINYVNHTREKRLHGANLVLENPKCVAPLLDIVFDVNDKHSGRAAWVLEFVVLKELQYLLPFLDIFTEKLLLLKQDAAIRPAAKICLYIIENYYKYHTKTIINTLTKKHLERITEACFEWLITHQKVAPKVYAMKALVYLGNDFDWIHPELAQILQQDYQNQSAGYKARARHILKILCDQI